MQIDSSNVSFPYEGILGLSPDVRDNVDDPLSLGAPVPLHLKNTGKIAEAIVAIDMYQDTTKTSTITFGGYDKLKFRNLTDTELEWF